MAKKLPRQYELADKAIALLNKRAVKRFTNAKDKLSLLKFDEVTVIQTVKALYEELDADNKKIFLDLAQMVYEATEPHGDREDEIDEMWLIDFLESLNPVTKYQYSNEVLRKREYTTEAVNASKTKAGELNSGLRKWSNFTAQYADMIADEAMMKAYKDGGVEKVKWNTEEDDSVCEICEPLDGQVFPIDKAPPKQHWHCRCWYTPA